MSIGCPVVCSKIDVFYEVAGDSCKYFNPNNISDIKSKIEGVLKSQNKQKDCGGDIGVMSLYAMLLLPVKTRSV